MATKQTGSSTLYDCPNCGGVLTSPHGSWNCNDCGYAPGHGAD